MTNQHHGIFALVCFISSILVWIPNIVFKVATPLVLLIFIIPVIGLVFAILGKKIWLIVGNVVMFFSFFILMAVGYIINS